MVVSIKRADRRKQVAKALRVEEDAVQRSEPKILSDTQRAEKLGVALSNLKTPFQLTPAEPRVKTAYLDLHSSILVLSESPGTTGSAWFHSSVQWPTFPGVQISFPRLKK